MPQNRRSNGPVKALLVRVHEPEPEVIEIAERSDIDMAIGAEVSDCTPYPSHLKKKRVFVFCDDMGRRYHEPLDHNRWGLVGDFVVARYDGENYLPLTEEELSEIREQLANPNEKGYLKPRIKADHGLKELYPQGEPAR